MTMIAILGNNEALVLRKKIRSRYRNHINKQRIRNKFCNKFTLSERTFYRKLKNNEFKSDEIIYLDTLLKEKKI